MAITDTTFKKCVAGFGGGAMHLQNIQHLQTGIPFSNITVIDCESKYVGGAVMVFAGKFFLSSKPIQKAA